MTELREIALGPHISLFQSELCLPTSPTIILSTWMNASSRNIKFYIQKYTTLNPTIRIILIRGIPSNMIYRSEATQIADLMPVIHTILAEPSSPIFVHLFSNSGAQQMGLLLRTFRKMQGKSLEFRGLVLDSSPALGTFKSAFDGLVYQVPKKHWWVRIPGTIAIYAIVAVVGAIEKATGNLNVLAQANADLLNKELIGEDIPRWYIYSKNDMLVKAYEVEWHARMAEEKGWKTEKLVYEDSGHCQHAKGVGEERYWKVIADGLVKVERETKL